MKQRKVPIRMCVVTHEKFEKKDLIRIVKTPENEILIDRTGKLNGKGAYIKNDKDVITKAQKSKVLDRILNLPVPDSIYIELLENIN